MSLTHFYNMRVDAIYTLSQYTTRPIIIRFATLQVIDAEYCAAYRKRRMSGLYCIVPAKTGHYSDMLNRVKVAYSDKYGRYYYNKIKDLFEDNTLMSRYYIKFLFKYNSIIHCYKDRYNMTQNQGSKSSDYLDIARFKTVSIARIILNNHPILKNNIQITINRDNITYVFRIEENRFKSMDCTISVIYKGIKMSYQYTITY